MKRSNFTFVLMACLALLFVVTLTNTSCRRKSGEPKSKICQSKPSYSKFDTIKLENCSTNSNRQRWLLPDGTQSQTPTIYFVPPSVGFYKFTLYVGNDDYIYDYESYVYVEVK